MRKAFSRENYKHLSSKTPLTEWVSEFLCRNHEYQRDRKAIPPKGDRMRGAYVLDLTEKYKVWFVSLKRKPKVQFHTPIKAVKLLRAITDKCSPEYMEMQERLGMEKLPEHEPSPRYHIQPANEDPAFLFHLLTDFRHKLKSFYSDTLLISIDMNMSRDDIIKEVKKTLKKTGKRKPTTLKKSTIENWKYYLALYDLRYTFKKDNDEIAYLMEEHFPEKRSKGEGGDTSPFFFEETHIYRFLDKAEKLIYGGYVKYLP